EYSLDYCCSTRLLALLARLWDILLVWHWCGRPRLVVSLVRQRLIAHYRHTRPVNDGEIDLTPPDVCYPGAAMLLVCQYGTAQLSASVQKGHAQVGSLQQRTSKIRPVQMRLLEIGVLQMCPKQVRLLQVGLPQVRPIQMRCHQAGPV